MSAPPAVHRLSNGATVICDSAPSYETLALSVVAGRGARWEDESRSGWSHLLEHMVFKGAGERTAKGIVEAIEAEGGQINAATGQERTSFQVRAMAGGLPLAIAVIADLMLRPTLDADDLAKEKQVVLQEIAEAADTPDDQVFELAHAAAFAGQPLGRPILGEPTAIAEASPAGLEAWRARLYSADRLVISAAGAVDQGELLELAAAHFGEAGHATSPKPSSAVFTGGLATEGRRLEQAHLVFLLPAPGVSDPGYWPLRLFAEMLGGGMSSRLFQEARERLGLAYAVDAFADVFADVGVLGIYAGCSAADADKLAHVAADQVKLLAAGFEPQELARAKVQMRASLSMGRESLAARAEQAAAQQLAFGRLISSREMADAIEAVSRSDIAALADRLLAPASAAATVLGPRPALKAARRFSEALFA